MEHNFFILEGAKIAKRAKASGSQIPRRFPLSYGLSIRVMNWNVPPRYIPLGVLFCYVDDVRVIFVSDILPFYVTRMECVLLLLSVTA